MSGSGGWREKHAALSTAGLFPSRSARERLESLDVIDSIISAARSANLSGLLDETLLNQLLEMSGSTLGIPQELDVPRKDEAGSTAPSSKPNSFEAIEGVADSDIGRTIAPISTPEPIPSPRPHGLPHHRLEDFPMRAKDVDMELEVHFDITGQSVTEGRMEDMVSCFSDRLKRIRRLLVEGRVLPNRPTPIAEVTSNLARHRESAVTVVGLVDSPKHTRNGHLMFDIEDESASMSCLLIRRDDHGATHAVNAGLMPDDAIGVTGRVAREGDKLYVEDIHFPPLPRHRKARASSDAAVSAAFLSDVHLGSRTFLEPQWHKLVAWFHDDPLAQSVRYFVLSGDGVDGVGIYPGQEKELAIKDLFDQYGELARLLELLPDHVDVLLLPGNHDAVRPAEPQPALDPEVQSDYNNATFVGNPCDFSLHGVRILSYHGKSIDDFVAKMRTVSYARPESAMRAMLERRHLAPSWGGKTPLSPEPEDRLTIPVVPDIFVTGHVHGHFVGDHKGVTMVHSSTWQDQTSYQRMLGFQPKPCMLTVVNLQTHASTTIPFA